MNFLESKDRNLKKHVHDPMQREINSKDEEFWSCGKQLYVDLARKYLNGVMQIINPGYFFKGAGKLFKASGIQV